MASFHGRVFHVIVHVRTGRIQLGLQILERLIYCLQVSNRKFDLRECRRGGVGAGALCRISVCIARSSLRMGQSLDEDILADAGEGLFPTELDRVALADGDAAAAGVFFGERARVGGFKGEFLFPEAALEDFINVQRKDRHEAILGLGGLWTEEVFGRGEIGAAIRFRNVSLDDNVACVEALGVASGEIPHVRVGAIATQEQQRRQDEPAIVISHNPSGGPAPGRFNKEPGRE